MSGDWEPEKWEPGYDGGPEMESDWEIGDCEVCESIDTDVTYVRGEALCHDCYHDGNDGYDDDNRIAFADPGGRSALRAETHDNPRNLPCPNCGAENVLTPADRAQGYQCDRCADQAERGW